MKICVLGGGNPHGLNFARLAMRAGHEVFGIGRSPLKGAAFTLGALELGYQYHVYSVGPDTEFIVDLLKKERPTWIVSFCAQGEGAVSFKPQHWKHFYRTNTQALVELTEQLHGFPWLDKFIQVGTSELYGSVESPSSEDSPLRPSSPYAISKAAFDLHLASIAKTADFPALIVRPSNCYCEGQQLHRVIPRAFIFAFSGARLPLQGGGKARKSYLHTDDLSRAILLLAEKGKLGEVYNCGPEMPTSIKTLLDACAQCLGISGEELYEEAPDRQGQDGCYWLNSKKLRGLGWEPQVHLPDGLARVMRWVKDYPELMQLPTEYRMRA